MSQRAQISGSGLTPILRVRDFHEAVKYYTKKLLFDLRWQWGKPPSVGCVSLGQAEIFFCLKGHGRPVTWLSLFHIRALKKKHGIQYDTHASYRFAERRRRRQSEA